MAIVFTWELQGLTPTTIDETDILQFAGDNFDDPMFVGQYNDSTHVKSSLGVDDSAANTPNNNKFISQTGGSGGKSQVQVNGGSTVNLDTLVNADAALHIHIESDVAVTASDGVFFSYDGLDIDNPPSGQDVRAAEIGDTNFTQAEGAASALPLSDQASNTDHDYYIVISKSPTGVGLKSDKLRIEVALV